MQVAAAVAFAVLVLGGCSDKATPPAPAATTRAAAVSDHGPKIAAGEQDLRWLSDIVSQAQAKSQGPLIKFTKHPCSDCVCRAGADLRNAPETHPCMATWSRIMASLEALQSQPAKEGR